MASLNPKRLFTQERARRTYESLIAAASELFAERGYDATQTPDIAAAAGVSVGTFYRYFQDKREVFLEIMQSHMHDGYEAVMGGLTPARFAGEGPLATIEQTMEVMLNVIMRNPRLERVFLEMSLRDDEVAKLYARLEHAAWEQLAALFRAICSPEQVPDPEATAYVVQAAAVESAKHIAGLRGEPPMGRERAKRALTRMVYRALFGDSAPDGQ